MRVFLRAYPHIILYARACACVYSTRMRTPMLYLRVCMCKRGHYSVSFVCGYVCLRAFVRACVRACVRVYVWIAFTQSVLHAQLVSK